MTSTLLNISFGAVASLGLFSSAVFANQMIPKAQGQGCPSGTYSAGSGYCKARDNAQYVPKAQGEGCPSGTFSAGSGYCKTR